MSPVRAPAAPPQIDGYRYLRFLAQGGFSDVHLYEQTSLRRTVAVKVLLVDDLDHLQRSDFEHEAQRMAALSHHPSIVTIHEAKVAASGQPYLVMEYYSRPTLAERCRAGDLPLRDVLSTAVRLGSAVETAHRAGFIHRDIKPANVLTNDFDAPALTDFGISVNASDDDVDLAMSLPWAAPELLQDPPRSGVASDVWALGATIHAALSGRAPFSWGAERPSESELMQRIRSRPRPSTGRSDVPAPLERLLDRALDKDPSRRPESAMALVEGLQAIERSLGLSGTDAEVPRASGPVLERDADDGQTRLRPLQVLPAPLLPAHGAPARHQEPVATAPRQRYRPQLAAPPVVDVDDATGTVLRGSLPVIDASPQAPPEQRRRWPLLVAAGVLVVAVGASAVALSGGSPASGPEEPHPQEELDRAVPGDSAVPTRRAGPADVSGTIDGSGAAAFRWSPLPGDPPPTYLVSQSDPLVRSEPRAVAEPSATLSAEEVAAAGGRACIEVVAVFADGTSTDPVPACAG